MMQRLAYSIVLAAVVAWAGDVSAHVTLEQRQAPAESTYKAVLRVSHGCEGSPTTTVRVQIPEGVTGVKPMPKPGWQLGVKIAPYAKPYKHRDEVHTEGVKEIAWSGGQLLEGRYDEFIFRASLPDVPAGTTLYFPVVQQCEKGVHRWIEIPGPGKTAKDYKEPAPALNVIEKNR